eukprot:PhF_6_TR2178/c0_g1_i2/m.3571
MSSYKSLFRQEPKRGTPEAIALLQQRGYRNLQFKLDSAVKSGDWESALRAIRGMELGNQHVVANSWHYSLVVYALVNGTTPKTPNRTAMLETIRQNALSGGIGYGTSLTRSLLYAYVTCGEPISAYHVLQEYSQQQQQRTQFPQSFGRHANDAYLALDVASGMVRHDPSLWEDSIRLSQQMKRMHHQHTGVQRKGYMSAHVALSTIGQWRKALEVISGGHNHDQHPSTECCVAMARDGNWDVALQYAMASPTQEGGKRISVVLNESVNYLGSQGLWETVLQLVQRSADRHKEDIQSDVRLHAAVIVLLTSVAQYNKAIEYYVWSDNDNLIPPARAALATSFYHEQGREAAERVLGSSDVIPS